MSGSFAVVIGIMLITLILLVQVLIRKEPRKRVRIVERVCLLSFVGMTLVVICLGAYITVLTDKVQAADASRPDKYVQIIQEALNK
jgi:uncharacterized membrane protein SpoIIM required for sporulation